MPTDSKKPTSAGLSDLLEGLLEAGVDFILVGGLAAVIQGAPVTTMDVDIVHSQSSKNAGDIRMVSLPWRCIRHRHFGYSDIFDPKDWGHIYVDRSCDGATCISRNY